MDFKISFVRYFTSLLVGKSKIFQTVSLCYKTCLQISRRLHLSLGIFKIPNTDPMVFGAGLRRDRVRWGGGGGSISKFESYFSKYSFLYRMRDLRKFGGASS